jgi:hypothetical protein
MATPAETTAFPFPHPELTTIITDNTTIELTIQVLRSAGVYAHAITTWDDKPAADQTWTKPAPSVKTAMPTTSLTPRSTIAKAASIKLVLEKRARKSHRMEGRLTLTLII